MSFSMTPREFVDRLQRGEPLDLVDVRTAPEFQRLHAAPARLMPLDELDVSVQPDPAKPVVLICKSGARAARGRDALRAAGRENVAIIEGGTDAWVAAGLACVEGVSRVPSLERQVRIAAGLLVTIGVTLGFLLHPAFLGLALVVGLGLTFAGITDTCGMAMVLAKLPWNRQTATACHAVS